MHLSGVYTGFNEKHISTCILSQTKLECSFLCLSEVWLKATNCTLHSSWVYLTDKALEFHAWIIVLDMWGPDLDRKGSINP